MAEFRYSAYDQNGRFENGTLDAESAERAREILKSRRLIVLSVEAGKERLATRPIGPRRKRGNKVKTADVAWMSRQLATTQAAGLPVFRALSMLGRQKEGTGIGKALEGIHAEMANGRQLSRAFQDHEDKLGTITTALITAGEASGTLEHALTKLAQITESRVRLKRKIRSAMAYPAVMLLLTLALMMAMMLFVAPTFKGLYGQLNGSLPLPTQILISISNVVKSLWFLIPAVPFVGAYLYRRMRKNPRLNAMYETVLMRAPVFGQLYKQALIARLASTLSSAMGAGVPLLDALDLAAQVAGNTAYVAALEKIKDDVRDGRPLHVAFGQHSIMPDLMVRLIEVGEDTGSLPDLLERYAKTAEEEVEITIDGLTSMLEPILIVVLGGIIGLMLIALYLPMFRIITLVK